MANIGFIGLGIMSVPMAGHLIAAGHTVFLHSRSGVPLPNTATAQELFNTCAAHGGRA